LGNSPKIKLIQIKFLLVRYLKIKKYDKITGKNPTSIKNVIIKQIITIKHFVKIINLKFENYYN
jgi:hypothetical protein